MTRSVSRPLTMAAAFAALISVASFPAANAEDFSSGIRPWTPDSILQQGPWRGLHYIAPPPAAYEAPFTGTPSKYPPTVFYGPSAGVTLDGTFAP